MILQDFLSSDIFKWALLPILIFLSRLVDVTLGTLRIIFVSRGNKMIAPVLGFFEVLIWIVAISQIMQNLNNPLCYIAYAGGFATGNYIGIKVEEKLAIGLLVVRIFLLRDECRLKERIIEAGFGVTSVDAKGANSNVTILYSIIKRKNLNELVRIIEACDSKAFYSVEETKVAHMGIFPDKKDRDNKIGFYENRLKFRKIVGGYLKRK